MPYTVPWNLLGLIVSGDIGDFTIYTDRHMRKEVFPRAPPKEPPTARQIARRQAFARAVRNYKSLTPEETAQWENVTRMLSMPLTGQNLFISLSFSQDNDSLITLNRQAATTLTLPPPVS